MTAAPIDPELLRVPVESMRKEHGDIVMEPPAWRHYQQMHTALEEYPKTVQAQLDTMLERGRAHGEDRYHEGVQDGGEGQIPRWRAGLWAMGAGGAGAIVGAVLFAIFGQ